MRTRDRLRSWFDSTMDRGTPALIGWLGIASLALIVVVTFAAWLLTGDDVAANKGWLGVLWMSLLRTLDPGTMGADTGSAPFLALMLVVTIGGIFLVSSLIGVLTTGLDNQITQLRRGRSRVIERGHTVILGWSDQVFTVIAELARANAGRTRSAVVVLADHDKLDMEEQLRVRVGDTGRTRVICRSGSPLKRAALDLTSLDTARSVIVMTPPGRDPDIDVIKVLLLLNNRPWPTARPHVIAAVQESANIAAARLAGGPLAHIIDADDIAVRLVAQSHRQSGLSAVCTDLLDFAGNEIYLRAEPRLAGRTYGEALDYFELGAPIGLCRADGDVVLNPPMDTAVEAGDQIVLIAEDDLLIKPALEPVPVDTGAIVAEPVGRAQPDRTLLIGWNDRAEKIINLLDRNAIPDSIVDVAAPQPPENTFDQLKHLTVGYKRCEPASRRSLETLDPGGYTRIVVLADDSADPDRADDRTLVTLLHLRDIEDRLGDPYSIVTEMNDDSNREVAQVTRADDFIVSARLISLLMTQLSENPHLLSVFADLFDPEGSEIHLKPAADYITAGTPVTYATVIEAARRRNETPIGYRIARADTESGDRVVLNPAKADLVTFTAEDSVIVVAED
ncbi:hypothetical protein QEZ54_24080 [Catellatospora sp. KI3]|uniref:CASTOR/POLLUX-related putative ion channel n=1 Tax=Catellatospora sp. KI3 TaxID=3041620 RepID=UPI002482A35A|nr:hypothetical protein [Catellatospora sp. KI3]MDI1464069.1 hypothetical protein [Catellatospora sp. KI3]